MRNRQVERPFESWISLGEAGQWLSGATPDTSHDSYWGGDVPWISASSLKNFDVIESERRLTRLGSMVGSQMAPPGSVIFVVRGMSLKNELRVGVVGRPVSFGQDCKVVIPRNGIDGHFLAYFMLSKGDHFVRIAEDAGHGTKRLVTSSMAEVQMPFLPVSEQRKVADVLGSLDSGIQAVEQLVAKRKSLRNGVVDDLFSGRHSWLWGALSSFLAASPKNGLSPSEVEEWTGVRVLGLGCLTPEGFSPRHLKNVPQNYSGVGSAVLQEGDLLMTRANTRELVGLVGRYEGVGGVCLYPDLMMRLRPSGKIVQDFLEYSLRHPYVRRQIMAHAVGTSESMVKISADIVRKLRIAVPSPEEQHRIVSTVKAHDERIAAERARLEKLRKLKTGLMDDLFTGRVRVDELQDLPV